MIAMLRRLWRPRRATAKCPYDRKTAWRRYRHAAGALGRTGEPGHVYWCPYAGGYHISRSSGSEYDQRRAGAA